MRDALHTWDRPKADAGRGAGGCPGDADCRQRPDGGAGDPRLFGRAGDRARGHRGRKVGDTDRPRSPLPIRRSHRRDDARRQHVPGGRRPDSGARLEGARRTRVRVHGAHAVQVLERIPRGRAAAPAGCAMRHAVAGGRSRREDRGGDRDQCRRDRAREQGHAVRGAVAAHQRRNGVRRRGV